MTARKRLPNPPRSEPRMVHGIGADPCSRTRTDRGHPDRSDSEMAHEHNQILMLRRDHQQFATPCAPGSGAVRTQTDRGTSRPAANPKWFTKLGQTACWLLLVGLASSVTSAEPQWVRPGITTNSPVWGIEGGLKFAIHPGGFTPRSGGPRGLIRLGYPTLENGAYDLINFIAVEPIVNGRKGFSELEKSSFDSENGKLFWTGAIDSPAVDAPHLDAGQLKTLSRGVEELSVTVFVEKFNNGAHVRLTLAQRNDRPDELRLTVESEPDSAEMDACILTATMGNKARTRLLFLKDGPVSSQQLYPDYKDSKFAPHRIFRVDQLPRAADGDVLVAFSNDEPEPWTVQPFGRPFFWDYKGKKVTQYWRKPAGEMTDELVCAVNARYTYWMSERPIPGGIAFENVELREPFKSGQSFIFGITHQSPLELHLLE